MKKVLFAFAICFILTACQAVDTTLPDASKKPGDIYIRSDIPEPIVGDYVKAGALSYVVTDVKQEKYLTINGVDYNAKKTYLIVSISVINRSSKPILVKPEMFSLVDQQGNKYLPTVDLDPIVNGRGRGFFHQSIEGLDRTSAKIIFDTNLDPGNAYLEVTGGPLSLKTARIKLIK